MLIDEFVEGRSIDLGPGVHPLAEALSFVSQGQTSLTGAGSGLTTILCSGDYESAITASGLTGLRLSGFTLDVNSAGRKLSARSIGIQLTDCRSCSISDVLVRNTVGGKATGNGAVEPGMAISIRGGERCLVDRCTLLDCGNFREGETSDGVNCSGDYHVVRGCHAERVSDCAYVLEGTNYSCVVACTAKDVGSGLAITLVGSASLCGNYADDVEIDGYAATVLGAVQLGVLGSAPGSLMGTGLTNLVVRRPAAASGPAIGMRRSKYGRIFGLRIGYSTVDGAAEQAILVDGENVSIDSCKLRDSGYNAIQVQPGSTNVRIFNSVIGQPRGGAAVCLNQVPASALTMANTAFPGAANGAAVRVIASPSPGPSV